MKRYLSKIDTNTSGNRYDVTPLFSDHASFAEMVEDLATPFSDTQLDRVVAIDALGFILGTAIAQRLHVGLVPIRKAGKLPVNVDRVEFVDYSGERKALEIRKDALHEGQVVLLVDEWIETSSQVHAAATLVEKQGAVVAGIVAISVDQSAQTAALTEKYLVHTVWDRGA